MGTTSWEELVGSTVEGRPLCRLIGAGEQSAVYLTSYGGEDAVIKLTPSTGPAPQVPRLEHPHIVKLHGRGECELAGSRYRYYLMEAADESLASVIQARPLTPEETQEMVAPVLDTLAYLHNQGLTHGAVKPSNILAKGESVKLSPDSVRPGPPEADMREVGLTIIEVLTQRRNPSGMASVPQPLRETVERCLIPAAPAKPAAAAPATKPTKQVPVWHYLAALLGAVVLVMVARVKDMPPQPPPLVQAHVAPPVLVVPPPASVKPGPAKPVPAKPTPVAPATVTTGPHGWFVVVASYGREADAAQQAQSLNRRFPQFKASVFPPSPIDTHYVVIIGSGLSEQGADSLRQRAVASGMSPDTYIKKYPAPR